MYSNIINTSVAYIIENKSLMELIENNDMAWHHTDVETARKQYSTPETKIDRIEGLFAEIMKELDLDLEDDSLQDTPEEWRRCMSVRYLVVSIRQMNRVSAILIMSMDTMDR